MAKCNKEPNSGVTVTAWNMGLLCQRCCRGGESELSSSIALDERALKETDTCSNSVFLWHGLAQSLTASLELESSSYRFSFRKRDHHMLNLPVPLIFQGHRDHQSPVHLTNGCQRWVQFMNIQIKPGMINGTHIPTNQPFWYPRGPRPGRGKLSSRTRPWKEEVGVKPPALGAGGRAKWERRGGGKLPASGACGGARETGGGEDAAPTLALDRRARPSPAPCGLVGAQPCDELWLIALAVNGPGKRFHVGRRCCWLVEIECRRPMFDRNCSDPVQFAVRGLCSGFLLEIPTWW